jgi:hypothetical protein
VVHLALRSSKIPPLQESLRNTTEHRNGEDISRLFRLSCNQVSSARFVGAWIELKGWSAETIFRGFGNAAEIVNDYRWCRLSEEDLS